MKKKIALITGGAGFIGSHLVEEMISRNYKVIVLDNLISGNLENLKNCRKKIKFFEKDIGEYKNISKYFKNVDVVFHLSALADIVPSIKNPENYFNTNVKGTLNVLRACVKNKVKKIIYAASGSCYGIARELPTSEKAEIKTEYPYALTKKLGEDLIVHWSKVYNLNFTSLRLFNVYGPRSRTSGAYGAMFGVFLAQKYFNKPLTIVGDGTQKRDFTYVSDVVSAFIKASNSRSSDNQIFNVGTGKAISVNYIAKLINQRKVHIPKRPGEPDITLANIKKIKNKLNWSPKININQGVKIMLNNINYWKKAPVWNPTLIDKATKDWFRYLK